MYEQLIRQLKQLPALRTQLQNMENALAVLTPEERLVANLLLVYPSRNNVQLVCEKLNVELSSVYRLRRRVLKKISGAMPGK